MENNELRDYEFQIKNVFYEFEEMELFAREVSPELANRIADEFHRYYREGLEYARNWHKYRKNG